MALLWGVAPPSGRGPRPALTVHEITAAAIAIADDAGLGALSMRRLADRLGVGAMSLYRYIPGRAELLDLMVDRANGEVDGAGDAGAGWRARLEHVARENDRLYRRHPWLLEVFPGRPPMGPGVLGKYDAELGALEDSGLSDVDMQLVLDLVLGYVRGAALTRREASQVVERTGRTDAEWWTEMSPVLEEALTPERYPRATRVGKAATAHYGGAYDADMAFEFGLARVLDGVAVLIDGGPREEPRPHRPGCPSNTNP